MSKKAVRLSIILLLFWATGGQTLLMQTIAWVNMVRNYSNSDTVCHALSKTFDGNHPCKLCLLIQKQKSEENKNRKTVSKEEKSDLFLVVFADLRVTFNRIGKAGFVTIGFQNWQQRPLSPPPKTV